MKKIMYMAVAAIAMLSSCSSEEFTQSSNGNNGEAKVFTGTIESEVASSRSTYDATAKRAFWETTDIVSINGVQYQAKDAGATTTFAKASEETAAAPTAPYYAFFADGANTGTGSYTADGKFTLPASYNYAAGKFNMPMYAYSESSTELSFKNLCGVLAITVPSSAMTSVSTIVVSSDQQLNGEFSVTNTTDATATATYYQPTFSGTPTTAQKKVTLNFASAVTISDSKTFYIPVPAGEHTLKVEIFAGTTGKYMTTSSAVTVARNNIYNITFAGINTSKAIDLGLSVNWAICNVGTTQPQSDGKYFSWGETNGNGQAATAYNSDDSAKEDWDERTNSNYTSLTSKKDYSLKYYKWGPTSTDPYKYKSSSNATLNKVDDAATANLGDNWRMPTSAEFLELARNCYIEWTSNYNTTSKSGIIVYKAKNDADKGLLHTSSAWKEISSSATLYSSSPKTATTATYNVSDTHIFLPTAGYYSETSNTSHSYGKYWSSSLDTDYKQYAFSLHFESDNVKPNLSYSRNVGYSVRAVCSE